MDDVGPINTPDIPQENDDPVDPPTSDPSDTSNTDNNTTATLSPDANDGATAPTDSSAQTTTAEPLDTVEEEDKGCGAVLTSGIPLMLLSLFGIGFVASKKND